MNREKNRTIVIYVHRTGLLSYFVNPICKFLSTKYQIIIFHLDEKNGYSYAPKESCLYTLYDLSNKKIINIISLLKEINPSAVLMLGFISIYEILMLRICKQIGLKTIYIEHGIYSKETSTLSYSKLINNFNYTVSKNVYFLKKYAEFILNSKNKKEEIILFWKCFKGKEYWRTPFDKGLFFAEYGYQKINNFFHYEEENVDYICYPLSLTNDEYKRYKEIATLPVSIEKKATFIHQPFILDGLALWTYNQERDWIVGISEMLKKHGYHLSVQLHPRSDINLYRKLFQGTGIDIVQNIKKEDYKKYSLVLGHYSTALLYPIFFRIPIMIIDYPNVNKAYDSTFFPLSCSLPLKNFESTITKYKEFSKKYLGEGINSFENVAEVIERNIDSF